MSLRLYHDPLSAPCRALTLFAANAGLDVDLVYVGLQQGEQHAAHFVALNPNRQVPVLVDGDFVLTEAAAILRYLADKAGDGSYPATPRARARIDERLDWFATQFTRDAAYGLVYPLFIPQFHIAHADTSAQLAHRARQGVERWLEVLDQHWLKGSDFVAGPTITIADHYGVAMVTILEAIGFDFRPYPAVRGWIQRMKGLPHWAECYAAFDGFLAAIRQPQAALAG